MNTPRYRYIRIYLGGVTYVTVRLYEFNNELQASNQYGEWRDWPDSIRQAYWNRQL
jgi:hypothetical protein